MKNNQGFTLIELIVVLIIIGILGGSAMLSIRSLDAGNAQSSVKRISAMLDFVRVQNMSKTQAYYLLIEKEDDSFVAKVQYDNSGTRKDVLTEKLKLKNGTITYYSKDASPEVSYTVGDYNVALATNVVLEISYNKGSGDFHVGSDGRDIKRIVITGGDRSYTIYLVKATGKHYIE